MQVAVEDEEEDEPSANHVTKAASKGVECLQYSLECHESVGDRVKVLQLQTVLTDAERQFKQEANKHNIRFCKTLKGHLVE